MSDSKIQMASVIVANYVAGNKLQAEELPALIRSVFKTLANVDAPEEEVPLSVDKPTAAQIRKSIRPEGLISFEDGKSYQTLKRHLQKHGLTIGAYKAKWGLPADYPATASDYSARRSAMARSIGLGKRAAAPVEAPKPAQRGRPKKTV